MMRILLTIAGVLFTLTVSAQQPPAPPTTPGQASSTPTNQQPRDSENDDTAEDEPIDCEELLKEPTPVSDYTKDVLERVKKAKEAAVEGEASDAVITNLIYWAGESIKGAIDNRQRVIEQWRNLPQRTTCEQYDIILLECALEDVRTEIGKAVGGKNYGGAYKLQQLFNFTNERLRSLLMGARDPRFADLTWGEVNVFDTEEEVWCCSPDEDACVQKSSSECAGKGRAFATASSCVEVGGCAPPEDNNENDAMCPFSSDYFPAGNDGFGCDESILKKLKNYKQAEREKESLEKISGNLKKFRKQAKEIFELETKIAELLGVLPPEPPDTEEEEGGDSSSDASSSSSSASEDDDHERVQGCIVGQCSNNSSESCSVDEDCGEGATCDRGWQECPENGGDCSIEAPDTFLIWEKRGPFSAVRDEPKLLDAFATQRQREPRIVPDWLKVINEKAASSSSSLADSPAEIREKVLQIAAVKGLTAAQGRAEADLYARGGDPGLQIAEVMKPVRQAGQPLMQIASQQTGLRQLVVRYAWFLRRTCIDRACNERLEQIIKFARAEKCYPYTNGSYLTQSCDDPVWKQCLEEAEVEGNFTMPQLDCE